MMQWIWQARDRGAQPDRRRSARDADRPHRRPLAAGPAGTDMALLNAMLRQVIHDGLVDEAYLADAHERLGGGPRRRRAVHAGAGRAHHRRAGRADRGGGAAVRAGADLADHARARHRAQHPRRQQLPRLHQPGARPRAGRQARRRHDDDHRPGQRPGRARGRARRRTSCPATATSTCSRSASTSPTSGASRRRRCPRRAPPRPRWST